MTRVSGLEEAEMMKFDWAAVRAAANSKCNIDILEARSGIDGCIAKDIRLRVRNGSKMDLYLLDAVINIDEAYRSKLNALLVAARRKKSDR